MLTNPGGPGGSGLGLATLGSDVPDGAGSTYDWIGFDPRGVGASTPSLSCDVAIDGYNRPYYVPQTPALEQTWLNRSRDYARKCGTAGGALLDHVTTLDTVQDMESIRQALGVSPGTRSAATTMRRSKSCGGFRPAASSGPTNCRTPCSTPAITCSSGPTPPPRSRPW